MTTDHHDGGFILDLRTQLQRRRACGLLGSAGAGLLLSGCDFFGPPGNAEPNKTATAVDGVTCIKDPVETNGPYPADGSNAKGGATLNVLQQSGLLREDIRSSFGGMTATAAGARMDMLITLVDVGNACKPLANHLVYVWHCDADGKYSLYDLEDRNYLRGAGITDAAGQVRFTTIFPGCYDGRWPHIHFEVFATAEAATGGSNSLLVSQFALPGDVATALYQAGPAYPASLANLASTTLDKDNVFGDNTAEQKAAMTLKVGGDASAGFQASAAIGIVTT